MQEPETPAFLTSVKGMYTRNSFGWMYIGEQDDDNNLTGSGIHIDTYGEITIGQWKDGERAPGRCVD